jgi:hypothetical protein
MGTITLEQLETKVLELSRDLAQLRLDFQKYVNSKEVRLMDTPNTNAPAHETLPAPKFISPVDEIEGARPVRATSPHGDLADVLGYPKDGR